MFFRGNLQIWLRVGLEVVKQELMRLSRLGSTSPLVLGGSEFVAEHTQPVSGVCA